MKHGLCHARRNNDLEGHSNFPSTIYSFSVGTSLLYVCVYVKSQDYGDVSARAPNNVMIKRPGEIKNVLR